MKYLPKDTKDILSNFRNIDNFYLKFHKYAHDDDEKFAFYKTDRGRIIYNDVEGFPFNGIKFKKLCDEIANSAKVLFPKFNHAETFEIDWRLAIGLGSESVYETSINLHPIYGFPYIPGQAVKGIVRSWVIQEYFNNNEGKAIENETFCKIFGCPKELTLLVRDDNGNVIKNNNKEQKQKYLSALGKEFQGSLVFFDAFPSSAPKLKVDVMNPHYGPYYSDNTNTKPPADYYNPVPIYFVTVEQTQFQFVIGLRENDNENGKIGNVGNTYFNLGKIFLKNALTQKGIGAKTSVGYGYFKE